MKNIRIGARLGLGFSVVMVLLALTTWLSLICLSSQNATTHSITKVAYPKSEAAAKITLLVTDIGRVSRNLILQSTPASLKKNKATFDANKQAIEAQMSVIKSRINNDDERTMFNTLRSHQGEYFTFVDRIASLALSGDKQGATDYLFAASNAQMQGQYVTALSAVTKFEDAQIETLANDSNSAYQMARLYVASAALLALILATISGWYIARSVTAPLRDAVGVAARISEGRLDAAIRPGHRDETGQLLNALLQMQGNLVKTVRLVRDNSENVATASSEIAQGNLDLSQRTEEQAASVAQTASSMAELTDSVKRNTENAVRASALSSKASEMAARGNDAVGQVAATMGDITRESRQVANIVGVIESIAFQTNILALNAAVEAARAGAEGRGFAVVANEVRTLAQRSAAAADILHMLLDERIIGLLSVMDHSPGQGQFRTVDAYVDYMCGNHALDRQTATAIAETKVAGREGALERMTALLEHATKTGIDVASHDDDSVARVAAMQKLGVRLTEFPIDAVTARAAVDAGMATILGAPNVMRGKSQSGAMRAIDAITAGTATCLCSDYQPSALLPAAFIAAQQAGLALHEAVALVTRNPATACGLHDRGRIAVGLRADLVALRLGNAWPTITQTWCEGRPVFSTQYPPSSAYVPVPSADDTDAQGASRFQSVVSTAEANLGSLTV